MDYCLYSFHTFIKMPHKTVLKEIGYFFDIINFIKVDLSTENINLILSPLRLKMTVYSTLYVCKWCGIGKSIYNILYYLFEYQLNTRAQGVIC
jgi:hypothetical protein